MDTLNTNDTKKNDEKAIITTLLRPSQILHIGEDYYNKLELLRGVLQQGFSELSGARLSLSRYRSGGRSNHIFLTEMTWPRHANDDFEQDDVSLITSIVDNNNSETTPKLQLNFGKEDDESFIRTWCGGLRPPQEIKNARQQFIKSLEIIIELTNMKRMITTSKEN
jgi:hypothetical protein